jgi:hypothetical protein
MTQRLFLLLLLALASACTTPSSTNGSASRASDALPAAWPRCPEWETQCGPAKGPDLWLTGKQAVIYLKPGKNAGAIRIIYEGAEQPRMIRNPEDNSLASDGQVTILGQTVDFYGSGNEDPEISTQPVKLTSPSGWSGWFSFDFSSQEHLKGRNIPAFSW